MALKLGTPSALNLTLQGSVGSLQRGTWIKRALVR